MHLFSTSIPSFTLLGVGDQTKCFRSKLCQWVFVLFSRMPHWRHHLPPGGCSASRSLRLSGDTEITFRAVTNQDSRELVDWLIRGSGANLKADRMPRENELQTWWNKWIVRLCHSPCCAMPMKSAIV